MSIHSYTLKSLLFLTLLLQVACSTYRNDKHKTPVELAAAEFEAALDEALVVLDQKAQDTGETGNTLTRLRKKVDKAWEISQETRETSQAQTSEAMAEVKKRFPSIAEKGQKFGKIARKKNTGKSAMLDSPKKCNEKIKNHTAVTKVIKAQTKFMKALEAELAAKSK